MVPFACALHLRWARQAVHRLRPRAQGDPLHALMHVSGGSGDVLRGRQAPTPAALAPGCGW